MKGRTNASPVDPGTCKKLLQHLGDSGVRALDAVSGSRRSVVEALASEYRPLRDRELEGLLAKQSIDTGQSGAIHCPPVLKGNPALMPLLYARIDFSGERPDAHFRLALFDLDSSAKNAIGWRFETPSQGDLGVHDYHHAQMVSELIRGKLLSSDQWYNQTMPAFLLDAHSPAGLIISLIVSLYGITYLNELLALDFRNEVRSVATSMESIKRYWERMSESQR